MIEGDLVMSLIPLLIQYSMVLWFSSVWWLAISMITLTSWSVIPWDLSLEA
jgi:hypothetical protein